MNEVRELRQGWWDIGSYGPAWGMLGTLLGLVNMMCAMGADMGAIGEGMSLALITTLYGSVLANWICIPTARKLEKSSAEEILGMEIAIEGVLSIQAGENSSIPVLCEALQINMNELLSGERLAEEVYSKKAEENMMTLMKETDEHKKRNKSSMVTLIVCLAAGMIKPFFSAFCMLGANGSNYTSQQREKSKRALRLGADSLVVLGALESLATVILLLGYYNMSVERLLANVAVALLTCLYGIVAYFLLLPVRCRLDAETEE